MKQIDLKDLQIGNKVHYQPSYYAEDNFENGIIKEIPKEENNNCVFVVYHWNNDLYNFKDYTAALTNLRDLKIGWREKQ